MFSKLFGAFQNIGSKLKTGLNIGRKIYSIAKKILPLALGQIPETISTYKSIENPIEKKAFKEQIADVIGKIPSNILLNPITEFLVKKKDEDPYSDDWDEPSIDVSLRGNYNRDINI